MPESSKHENTIETGSEKESESIESIIKAELDDLDMITTSAMAIMLSDSNERASSPYIDGLIKADINEVLLTFLIDTYGATDIRQIDDLLDKKYYHKKIKKYFRTVPVFVKRGISYTLPGKSYKIFSRMRISGKQTGIYIDKICETIRTFEDVKYIPALSGNKETSSSKRNYKLDHLSDHYKDALIYLIDTLLTCTCISKILFIERMIRKLPADSEFVRIVINLTESTNDLNAIISKSRPVYNQFYKAQLGYIDGDDILYGMAITIMVNLINKTDIQNTDILKLEYKPMSAEDLDRNMRQWLDILAKYDYAADIGVLILQRTTLLIKENYDLLLDALSRLLNWERYYGKRVAYYMREREKELFLKGSINKDILELPG